MLLKYQNNIACVCVCVCVCVQDSEHVQHGYLDSSYFLKLFHFSKAVIYGHTLSWKASALMYKLVRACNAIRV